MNNKQIIESAMEICAASDDFVGKWICIDEQGEYYIKVLDDHSNYEPNYLMSLMCVYYVMHKNYLVELLDTITNEYLNSLIRPVYSVFNKLESGHIDYSIRVNGLPVVYDSHQQAELIRDYYDSPNSFVDMVKPGTRGILADTDITVIAHHRFIK